MQTGGRRGSHGQGGGPMGKAAKTGRKRPGLTRRMIRSTLRVGMLATAVLVGRKTAGGGKARDGQTTRSGGSAAPQGPGAAAGGQLPPEHTTSLAATGDGGHGRQADVPQEIPPKGWLDIAKRTGKEVKADQVPLLSAGVVFYALLALFPAIIAAGPAGDLRELLADDIGGLGRQQLTQVTSGAGGALGVATV